MAKHTATVLVLLCCAALSTAQARLLQQSDRCPTGCAEGSCVLDSSSGGYKCTLCMGSLVVNPDDGTCGCPAGRFGTTDTCQDCDKGSWCAGGKYDGPNTPVQNACPNSLTTVGKRSTSIKQCVNLPGRFYTIDVVTGEPGQTICPVDTYGPGLQKQRACVPCPPGFSTKGLDGKSKASDCYVPPGYFLKGPGQVAPCPKGEYKSGYDAVVACTKCAEGVTTLAEASPDQAHCVTVLPTYYPASISTLVVDSVNVGDYVATTKKCPQKFYCPGGEPTAAFSPASPTSLTGTTVVACPKQTWTEGTGASDESQCMTPPGYKTVGDVTDECDAGSYRAEWKPADQAGSCDLCGDNILSDPTDEITAIDISDYESTTKVFVRASASACYVLAGQGMYFSAATGKYSAVDCDTNNYGLADKTYGLAAYPCRDCPSGMQTSVSLENSNNYHADNGFTNPKACVTKAGYGYNGRVANKCPVGSYNAAGNYGTCTQCPVGKTTVDNADNQVTVSDCGIAKGYGYYNGAIIPCPVGTYNNQLRDSATAPCGACPDGLTTSQAGADDVADCNMCKPGWGGDACGTQCGGDAATFGVAGRPSSALYNECAACPTMSTGFSYDYEGGNQAFTPAPVARIGAASAADCLAEFAQVADGAWYMGGAATMTDITGDIADTFAACVAACKADGTCQYITYDYDAKTCLKKTVGSANSTGDVLAFKAVVAGDATAASKTKANALASGSYTFWKETAAGVGASSSAGPTSSLQACLSACDTDAACAAVAISGATSDATAAVTGCSLLKGNSNVATFKRSVTKAVTSKLAVSAGL